MYYIGLLEKRESYKINTQKAKVVKEKLIPIVAKYKLEDENIDIRISDISSKIKIVRDIALWAKGENIDENDKYLKTIYAQFQKIELDEFFSYLKNIVKWENYRNELVHALMNKNVISYDQGISKPVETGEKLGVELDNKLKNIKNGCGIRKTMNLEDKKIETKKIKD